MEINQQISGFRLIEERSVPETDSLGRLFIHEKSGARLLQLANNDSNKVFGIGFRTPSENSTGVAYFGTQRAQWVAQVSHERTFYGSFAFQSQYLP